LARQKKFFLRKLACPYVCFPLHVRVCVHVPASVCFPVPVSVRACLRVPVQVPFHDRVRVPVANEGNSGTGTPLQGFLQELI
jgi:hypothetical protein